MAEKTDGSFLFPTQSLLSLIRESCQRLRITSLNRRIEICEAFLTENPPIDVAILGQFKAGKSSFLNGFLEKPILPTGVVPVTTVITRLQYGPGERATVALFDGSHVEIPLENLADFISEAGNPGNAKNVEVVDVETPLLENYPGLRLVDTPGLGGVFKAHMKTAQDWLPEVGTAIVAVSSDRPLSGDDLELLRELARHTPNVILLLTKVDLLTPEQRTEVVRFLEGALERELGVKLAEADWRIEVAEPSRPDIGFIRVFDFHFDLLWFLIPMALFRKLFERHFLTLIPRAVEMNLSRLGAQWEGRINAAIEEMRKQSAGYVRDEIATIEALLAGSDGKTEEIEGWIEDLKTRLSDPGQEGGRR